MPDKEPKKKTRKKPARNPPEEKKSEPMSKGLRDQLASIEKYHKLEEESNERKPKFAWEDRIEED